MSEQDHVTEWSRKALRDGLIAVAGTTVGTLLAFVLGMGSALSWPLSVPNLEFAMSAGGCWGGIGSVLVLGVSLHFSDAHRVPIAILGACLWAAVSGMCFCAWVAAIASC